MSLRIALEDVVDSYRPDLPNRRATSQRCRRTLRDVRGKLEGNERVQMGTRARSTRLSFGGISEKSEGRRVAPRKEEKAKERWGAWEGVMDNGKKGIVGAGSGDERC